MLNNPDGKGRLNMKKFLVLLLALLMPVTALAEEVTANGVVESRVINYITAPFSGVVKPFDAESGDRVETGDELFEMQTTQICAPVDGTVQAVFAGVGEQAGDVMAQYGMLASIQKKNNFVIIADTDGAYKDAENRYIHAGETVYFEQSNDKDNEGEGRVISVNGKNYVVEILKGDFEDEDDVKIYRDEKMGTKSAIGSGEVDYAADMTVSGTGYVVDCLVREGDTVRQGEVMFEVVSQDAESSVSSAAVKASASGALEMAVQGGMQVYKGQLMAKVHDLKELSVIASVDEMDLGGVSAGSSLAIVFDRYPEEMVMGTVSQISAIGTPRQNASYYDVTVDFYTTLDILPGMNATVYISK